MTTDGDRSQQYRRYTVGIDVKGAGPPVRMSRHAHGPDLSGADDEQRYV